MPTGRMSPRPDETEDVDKVAGERKRAGTPPWRSLPAPANSLASAAAVLLAGGARLARAVDGE
jgi:hypothetical protein